MRKHAAEDGKGSGGLLVQLPKCGTLQVLQVLRKRVLVDRHGESYIGSAVMIDDDGDHGNDGGDDDSRSVCEYRMCDHSVGE